MANIPTAANLLTTAFFLLVHCSFSYAQFETTQECMGPYPSHPICEERVQWMLANWDTVEWSQYYRDNGVDGTRCTIQHFLAFTEQNPPDVCPPPEGSSPDEIPGQYLVKLKTPPSVTRVASTWSSKLKSTAAIAPGLLKRTKASNVQPIFPGIVRVTGSNPGLLKSLQTDAEVEYVEPDTLRHAVRSLSSNARRSLQQSATFQPVLDAIAPANCEAQTSATWGIDRVDQSDLPLDSTYTTPDCMCGAGAHVWVLDTGIKVTHSEFAGRMGIGASFVEGTSSCACTDPSDPLYCGDQTCDGHGHGTHCAGTAAGTAFGVAKCATVHGVKVLSDEGSGSTSGIVEAIGWVVEQGLPNSVISMSLGGPGVSSAFETAIDDALAAGVVTVVAAGNSDDDACDYSPAHATNAVTVGATTSSDSRSWFSNYGTCVDVFAPGSDITSAGITSNTAQDTMSGTSMACPHVAGAAALLLAKDQSNTSPALVINALTRAFASAGKVSDPGAGSPNFLLNVQQYGSEMPVPTPTQAPPPSPPSAAPTKFCVTQSSVDVITGGAAVQPSGKLQASPKFSLDRLALARERSMMKTQSDNIETMIVGGSPVPHDKYPFQVSIQTQGGSHFCGGSLIDKQWVLTAAHCVTTGSNYKVVINIDNINKPGADDTSETFNTVLTVKHNAYNENTMVNDIALLKLNGEATSPTVAIETSTCSPYGSTATVMGYGTTSSGGNLSPQLLEVDVPIITNDLCSDHYGSGMIADTMICAGEAGLDSCQGDSGGPLLIKGTQTQIGIVSWGYGCAADGFEGVYTNACHFAQWVQDRMDDPSQPPPSPTAEAAPTEPGAPTDPDEPPSGSGTCQDSCGGVGSGACHCDELCSGFGDCCEDFQQICACDNDDDSPTFAPTATTPTPAPAPTASATVTPTASATTAPTSTSVPPSPSPTPPAPTPLPPWDSDSDSDSDFVCPAQMNDDKTHLDIKLWSPSEWGGSKDYVVSIPVVNTLALSTVQCVPSANGKKRLQTVDVVGGTARGGVGIAMSSSVGNAKKWFYGCNPGESGLAKGMKVKYTVLDGKGQKTFKFALPKNVECGDFTFQAVSLVDCQFSNTAM